MNVYVFQDERSVNAIDYGTQVIIEGSIIIA